jgi:hypothetical protein
MILESQSLRQRLFDVDVGASTARRAFAQSGFLSDLVLF